jgi:2,5-diamino-6-(ribosylamino)-4(3H)-pyrimidinone 5'-phosphate reductase
MNRPITTLFMLESLDGKINSGSTDLLDVDRDWKTITGVKEGLHQYYEIESNTDLFSLNTGRVMEKIGINTRSDEPEKIPCSFIIIDNKPHLNENGIDYLCRWVNKLYLVTTNKSHVAYSLKDKYDNLVIMEYDNLDLNLLMTDLYTKYNVDRVTIQSGGSLNKLFLENNLFDYIHVVVAPILVGGSETSTLIDGKSITTPSELNKLKSLTLINCKVLEDSYIELEYKVNK